MKETLKKVHRNQYLFTDANGQEWDITLERIPYTDDDCWVDTALDLDTIEDPVIKMQIEGLDSCYESSEYDCADWDLVNDEIEKDD